MAEFSVSNEKLQHIYDLHAEDFGLLGNKNPEQLRKLYTALESHLNDGDTELRSGKYRGEDALLYYNPASRNVIVTDKSNSVVAGFRVSQAQAEYIRTTGRLN